MENVTPLLALGFSPTVADRLHGKLVRAANGCLEWTGSKMEGGHGHMSRGARGAGFEATHRVAWMLANGPIPDGKVICHRCDNPPCCDPEHLFLGTQADNMQDMWAKNRGCVDTLIPAGERHPDAKLSDAQIVEMRAAYPALGNYAALGRQYGVSKQHARNVVLGRKRAS